VRIEVPEVYSTLHILQWSSSTSRITACCVVPPGGLLVSSWLRFLFSGLWPSFVLWRGFGWLFYSLSCRGCSPTSWPLRSFAASALRPPTGRGVVSPGSLVASWRPVLFSLVLPLRCRPLRIERTKGASGACLNRFPPTLRCALLCWGRGVHIGALFWLPRGALFSSLVRPYGLGLADRLWYFWLFRFSSLCVRPSGGRAWESFNELCESLRLFFLCSALAGLAPLGRAHRCCWPCSLALLCSCAAPPALGAWCPQWAFSGGLIGASVCSTGCFGLAVLRYRRVSAFLVSFRRPLPRHHSALLPFFRPGGTCSLVALQMRAPDARTMSLLVAFCWRAGACSRVGGALDVTRVRLGHVRAGVLHVPRTVSTFAP
jgi:hypothetical protein